MTRVAKPIAVALMGIGAVIMAVGGVNWLRANEGLASLDAVYEAQNVTLDYNDEGQLIDRGEPEEAQAILTLLEDDWQYPVDHGALDPADPLVNTPTELMYQYAVISYHILHGTETVTLEETVEYEGETFEAGTYEVPVDGRYWTDFDRMHPLEGPTRDQAWSDAHGLLASISSGVAADYQAGFAHFAAWRTLLVGLGFVVGGAGLFAVAGRKEEATVAATTQREREAVNA